MKIDKSSISAALVTFGRWVTAFFPEPKIVPADEITAIQLRCWRSYHRLGHCECPWPVSWPLRRGIWVDEMGLINRAADSGSDVVPIPIPPAPVPEEEPDGDEREAAKQTVNWEREDAIV